MYSWPAWDWWNPQKSSTHFKCWCQYSQLYQLKPDTLFSSPRKWCWSIPVYMCWFNHTPSWAQFLNTLSVLPVRHIVNSGVYQPLVVSFIAVKKTELFAQMEKGILFAWQGKLCYCKKLKYLAKIDLFATWEFLLLVKVMWNNWCKVLYQTLPHPGVSLVAMFCLYWLHFSSSDLLLLSPFPLLRLFFFFF